MKNGFSKGLTKEEKLEIARKYLNIPEKLDKGDILLVTPTWRKFTYLNREVKSATISHPPLAMATIASPLVESGYNVRILDLDLYENPGSLLKKTIEEFKPKLVATSGSTPLFDGIVSIAKLAKEIDKNIITVVGGPHATAFPEHFLETGYFDYVVNGQGDFVLLDILNNKNRDEMDSIAYMDENNVIKKKQTTIEDLDIIPMPSWHLVEVEKYANSYILSRKNPVGPIETSRGCHASCCYCNKKIFGWKVRFKSSKRVVDEMQYMLEIGFNELHVQDDLFSSDLKRAKEIADLIVERKMNFPWMLTNGVRVDTVDLEFLLKIKKAGCYRLAFGIESGNQEVLDSVQKNITLDQVRRAVKLAKIAKIETFGFFMLALPTDTEETMQQTIDFAKELDVDLPKFVITTPYPGTRLYDIYDRQNLIKSKNWSDYLQHNIDMSHIFNHPNLSWDTIAKYYKKAFREVYFRPNYIYRRFKKSLKEHTLIQDMKTVATTSWF